MEGLRFPCMVCRVAEDDAGGKEAGVCSSCGTSFCSACTKNMCVTKVVDCPSCKGILHPKTKDRVAVLEACADKHPRSEARICNILALLYNAGLGVKANADKSIMYTQRAIELGNTDAYEMMGNHYMNGFNGLVVDKVEAYKYYEKSGSQMARHSMALLLMDGQGGIVKDVDKGVSLLRALATEEYHPSMLILIDLLGQIGEIDVAIDRLTALVQETKEPIKRAAQTMLVKYLRMKPSPENEARAAALTRDSEPSVESRALFVIGMSLIRTDRSHGISFLRQAAAAGCEEAITALGQVAAGTI